MTDYRRPDASPRAEADPNVTARLREQYAAPADDRYWSGLEQRVMRNIAHTMANGVRELRPAWWSGFAEFRAAEMRTVGLIAATIALLVAGATFVQEQAHEARARDLATRAAVQSTLPLPINEITLTSGRVRLAPDAPERYLNPLDY